ncbi:MAG: zinc ribbon domain-containing protein [Aggregatilineales bacterium]
MSQAEGLYRLQEIDLDTARARRRLQEISAALADNQAVQAAQEQVNRARQTLTPLQVRSRDLDLEIKSNAEKAKSADKRLYSGVVKNPKEMQDLQQEIASLAKWRSELETQLLETIYAIEEAEAALSAAEAALEQTALEWERARRRLLDEQAELNSRLEHNRQRRERVLAKLTPESLQVYNTLRQKKHNQPAALMENGTCSICGVAQNLAVQHQARQGLELAYCTNCGRVLVPRP